MSKVPPPILLQKPSDASTSFDPLKSSLFPVPAAFLSTDQNSSTQLENEEAYYNELFCYACYRRICIPEQPPEPNLDTVIDNLPAQDDFAI